MSAAPRTLLSSLRGAVRARAPAQSPRPWTSAAAVQARSLASAVEAQPNKGLTRDEVQQIYDSPLMELIYRAVSPLHLLRARRPNRHPTAPHHAHPPS